MFVNERVLSNSLLSNGSSVSIMFSVIPFFVQFIIIETNLIINLCQNAEKKVIKNLNKTSRSMICSVLNGNKR